MKSLNVFMGADESSIMSKKKPLSERLLSYGAACVWILANDA
jgi:hypothetical protein